MIGDDQFDIAVNTPVDVMDRRKRQYISCNNIPYGDPKVVFRSEFDGFRDLESKSGRSSPVAADVFPVYKYFGDVFDPVKFQEKTFAGPGSRNVEFACVVSRRAQVVRFAGEGIQIPGMGQGDAASVVAAVFVAKRKQPVVVEQIDLSCL